MNTALKISVVAQIAAVAVAAMMTMAMLGGVERLAEAPASAGLVAQTSAAAHA